LLAVALAALLNLRVKERYDVVIIGSGPNGLAAGITLAREGKSVLVLEARAEAGGGARSAELTLPGYVHDVCSAIHPMASSSPFFRSVPLAPAGLEWVHPEVLLAHPFDDGSSVVMRRSLSATVEAFPEEDRRSYQKLFAPLVQKADPLFHDLLGPPPLWPRAPGALIKFGLQSRRSAQQAAEAHFQSEAVRALFLGNAAHAYTPLHFPLTSAFGLALHLSAHHAGWPVARGGSQKITDALVQHFLQLGGELRTGVEVKRLRECPPARAYLFDTIPSVLAHIAQDELSPRYRDRLLRYRHGPAAYKLDLALSEPIPWKNELCRRAGTVHVGGSGAEIAAAESAIWEGKMPERPFVLVGQQSVCDASRAPEGKHTAWVYGHVPHGWTDSADEIILNQVERFAPGFRQTILAQHVMRPADFHRYNPSYLGGDITGGANHWTQLFTRPLCQWNPYTTPHPQIFLGSASTPPGGGVHGMAGWHAARTILQRVFGKKVTLS
jgi:phytoene dehydrogenase-like protein